MLGTCIKAFREKQGFTLEELAHKSSCSINRISRIERGLAKNIDHNELVSILDALTILDACDFMYLMRLNKHHLRFKVYNVGILKTGTKSIAEIFGNYKSEHEFMFRKTTQMVIKYHQERITRKQFIRFIKEREITGLLEMDSSSFNYSYLDILAEEFPTAKFIFTIRDCYSWTNSVINMYVHGVGGGRWLSEYTEYLFGIKKGLFEDEDAFRHTFPDCVDRILSYWAVSNAEVLKYVPPGRSLMVKTNEISDRIGEMADFVGVPAETLERDVHANITSQKIDMLHDFDRDFLNSKFDKHCSELMERFFPSYTLQEFLCSN